MSFLYLEYNPTVTSSGYQGGNITQSVPASYEKAFFCSLLRKVGHTYSFVVQTES